MFRRGRLEIARNMRSPRRIDVGANRCYVGIVVIAASVSSSCAASIDYTANDPGIPTQKSGASPVRYDVEPLEQRFPKLPVDLVGEWVQGFYGDTSLPGPDATFWVDAVLEIPPAQLSAFVAPYASTMIAVPRPQLWPSLISGVSATSFEHSKELDHALSTRNGKNGWEVKAYVPDSNSVLVLIAQGRDAGEP